MERSGNGRNWRSQATSLAAVRGFEAKAQPACVRGRSAKTTVGRRHLFMSFRDSEFDMKLIYAEFRANDAHTIETVLVQDLINGILVEGAFTSKNGFH